MSTYPNLTEDDVAVITAFFNYVDTNNDGYISISEINDAMTVDLNEDGTISDSEKITCGQGWIASNLSTEDMNGDDLITLAELLQYNNNT
jgi:hypothetical protein